MATPVLALPGPRFLRGPTSGPGPPLNHVPLPGSASDLHPGLGWPPSAPGDSAPLPVWRPRREAMASQRPPGSPVTRAHTGEGVRVAEAAV